MYTKTERIIDLIEQSGTAPEEKTLATLWSPTLAGQRARIQLYITGTNDDDSMKNVEAVLLPTYDGMTLSPGGEIGGMGTHPAFVDVDGDELILKANYEGTDPYECSWSIRITIEEFTPDA